MKRKHLNIGIACLALFALAVCMAPISMYAQSTTQGSIAGTVLDQSQAAIPNAAVSIQNTATGFSIQLVTDTSGFFKAPLLEPGTYTVSINSSNFAKYRAESVTVVVGQTTSLTPILSVASSSSEVVVTEQAPVMNMESPDFTGTLTTQALQSIPINNRRWSSLAMTTPGVVSDSSGYGLVSVRGISTLLNNVEIDGADDNQAFFSEERGRTREAYSTSANAVREFAVNTGVYSAQYGRAAGGVITSVTKSGTNSIHGQAYFFDKESNWNAYNNYTKVTNFVNGSSVTSTIKPKDLRKIWGFTAGGPLIKDKLFWIYTYDQHSHVFPVIGVPYNATQFYTLPVAQASFAAGESCNTTTGLLTYSKDTNNNPIWASLNDTNACALAARQHISYNQAAYDWAAMLFGSKTVTPGSYAGAAAIQDIGLNTDIGQVPRFGYQLINTPKIDWQITPKMHWSALYHRLRWDSPGGVQTTASDMYARDAQGNDYVKLDYGVTKLTSLITNNISNEILYQFGRELNWEGQQDLTDYTKSNIAGGGNIPQLEAGYNYGFNAGSMYYAHRTAYPDEHKWQIGDILYWNKGSHSLKLGVDTVHNYDLMNNTYKSNGDFSYNWVGNMFNDMLNIKNGVTPNSTNLLGCDSNGSQNGGTVTGAFPCYFSFTQGFGNPVYTINTLDLGIFVQDNWKFNPRLTLELGLRWDHETMPGPDANLTTATGTFVPYNDITNNPTDNTDFGPRVGFAYDLLGSGKTVLRGGYGLYFGRITNGNIENIRLNTGSPNGQFSRSWNGNTTGAPVFPNIFASAATSTCTPGTSSCPSSYYMSPNLKLPEVMEFDLLLQQDLGKGTVFALSYLGGLGRRLPNFLNLNLNPATVSTKTITIAGDASGKGPLGADGTKINVPVYTSYGNQALFGSGAANFGSITQFVSNVNSNYNAMVVEILNRSLKQITFNANYTWSHALDFMQNANTQGTANAWYDPFSNARANYGSSGFNVPSRFVAYALYNLPNLNSSNPFKWVANGWSINNSFQMQNGLPFTAGANSKPSGAIGTSWNGAGGTSLIPQIGYNTQRYPRRIVDDVRIQKEVAFERGRNLQLMLNVFNVANHQNVTGYSTTSLYNLSVSGTNTTATYTGQDGTGTSPKNFKVVNNSNSSAFLYTPRQVEISARFNF
jgi:outer membrane receptor protein involved in Fe transport